LLLIASVPGSVISYIVGGVIAQLVNYLPEKENTEG
jgi:hypothetical protein